MSRQDRIQKRNEISKNDTWAMEDMFASITEWEKEYDMVVLYSDKLKEYAGKLSRDAKTLLEYLTLRDQALFHMERVFVYAKQKYDEDTTNSYYQNLTNKAQSLEAKLNASIAFDTPEILQINDEVLNKYYEENQELKKYKRMLSEITRKRAHTLSAKEEALLADATELLNVPGTIYSMFNNADLKFDDIVGEDGEKVPVTHGRFISYLGSQDRRVRKDAYDSLYSRYTSMRNTAAAMFRSNVKASMFKAQARHYESTLHMYLDDSNVPVEVYTNLIETVHANLPKFYKYVALRKKMLGVEELHMYDVYAPLVSDVEMKYTFEQAKQLVLEGLAPLGSDYISLLKEGFDNRWIDVYENEGKRSGAYSWGAYGTHPYVLLNYNGTLDNVFTLAHEMGHALHSYHSDEAQPYVYAGYKIFVAEVASTCNEALLIQYLLNKITDKKQRAYLVNHFIESFKGTLFRQTMFAEFERITHGKAEANESLTADLLCEVYHGLNEKYFGKEMHLDAYSDMEWARIPHFYTPFYVYQYATGFSAAIALSRKILNEGESALQAYKQFLSSGSSMDPIDLLKIAGVDMSSKTPIEDALKLFDELVDELEKIANS